MITLPASNTLRVMILLFIAMVLILFGGAFWYKQLPSETALVPITETTVDSTTEVIKDVVDLKFTPTTVGTYTVTIEGLTEPINGIAFQMIDPPGGPELTSSTFTLDQNLEQSGWSSAINNSTDSETGKMLSFSILKTSPTEATTETINSITLGTLSFENADSSLGNAISIVTEESFATYTSGKSASIRLITE